MQWDSAGDLSSVINLSVSNDDMSDADVNKADVSRYPVSLGEGEGRDGWRGT